MRANPPREPACASYESRGSLPDPVGEECKVHHRSSERFALSRACLASSSRVLRSVASPRGKFLLPTHALSAVGRVAKPQNSARSKDPAGSADLELSENLLPQRDLGDKSQAGSAKFRGLALYLSRPRSTIVGHRQGRSIHHLQANCNAFITAMLPSAERIIGCHAISAVVAAVTPTWSLLRFFPGWLDTPHDIYLGNGSTAAVDSRRCGR
ncbi:hypothetical protein R1flu_016877 [Riccia fluitans]|uniref:Uncharacterized protein n=1 Tax=Riccia fluitans TaxID=41844 RepID=A0ABD1YN40_9MARC